jgi:hypothetical protein
MRDLGTGRKRGVLLVLAATIGCGDSLDPTIGADCQAVAIQVSAEQVPRFTWAPACRMGQLEVVRNEPTEVVWHLTSDSTIESGVRYGTVPAGVDVVTPAHSLITGERYYVRLGRLRVGVTPVEYADVGAEFFVQ